MSYYLYTKPYNQGIEARNNGWERISPYTGTISELYWYAGYDGIDIKKVR